jgi:excinuclease ABC subunit A
MSKQAVQPVIRLKGVRHNNLKNFDLDLPLKKLIVVTGLSGSGKSSLAFDTLFAEGQRRYIETFSPYARQFFDRMDKPRVDKIEGIPPAIAIEQRNTVKTTRSTVGTMTEICDYAKLIWAHVGQLRCRSCRKPVCRESPRLIWETVTSETSGKTKPTDALITFEVPLSDKLSLEESLALIAKQGYQRLFVNDAAVRLEDLKSELTTTQFSSLTVVQDRLTLSPAQRARFSEACEQAYHFGKGRLKLHFFEKGRPVLTRRFSNHFHCAECDLDYREPSPALFSFNHPVGACPTCRGFGRVIGINYDLAIPDRSKTLGEGAVRPWQTGQSAESQQDLIRFCKKRRVPTDVPFDQLPEELQAWVIDGDPGYGTDAAHEWPRAWYGVKGYFRWLESKAYKMHVRVLLSRYRAYHKCPDCHGKRLRPDALLYTVQPGEEFPRRDETAHHAFTIADFYNLPVHDALKFVELLLAAQKTKKRFDPLILALREVYARLNYLNAVGLGYLTLDRPTRTLSGGETERVNLTTCLGSGLVNTLFVLDEPTVGLHPRDTERLIQIVQNLRNAGNTVVVVEHEPSVMRAADQIVDLGPGHGESGGDLVFQGSYAEILNSKSSLTGAYLSGKKRIESPSRRAVDPTTPKLTVTNANTHNLKNITLEIPLHRFVCLTGVSGSGKTTLLRDVLVPLLNESRKLAGELKRNADTDSPEEEAAAEAAIATATSLRGAELIGQAVLVDQSSLGRTPRSNPIVYIGAFDFVRELFAQTEMAKQRGLNASAFSFNSAQGQCEKCRGAGFEKIEMQFLSDVFIRCSECDGRRYRAHILENKLPRAQGTGSATGWSIADVLEATIDEVLAWLETFKNSKHAERASVGMKALQDVGLGYLRAGQPINTLSGGESQRLKLASHLIGSADKTSHTLQPTLFLFDEPTTGLHLDDVRVLLQVFQRLVEAGHSVVVIEHNLDLIKCADWVIDLGPEAGDTGGEIVAMGTPETVSVSGRSHTGKFLQPLLRRR